MARPRIDVVHVGSACRDIAPDDPRGWRLGGGVTYAALTTARLGLRTAAVVGVDADAAGAHELDALRAAGVDILTVGLDEGPVFHNVETPDGRVQTLIARGVPVRPVPLPESWLATTSWSLVPVAGEVDDGWVGQIAPDALVAVAWQGMLRRLVAGRARRTGAAGRPGDPPPCRSRRHEPPRRGARHLARRPVPFPPRRRAAARDAGRPGRPADHDRRGRPDRGPALPADPDRRRGRSDGRRRHVPCGSADGARAPAAGRHARVSRWRERCGSRRPPDRSRSRTSASTACRIGTAVLVRRARERVRRTVVPSLRGPGRRRGSAPVGRPAAHGRVPSARRRAGRLADASGRPGGGRDTAIVGRIAAGRAGRRPSGPSRRCAGRSW